MDLTKEGPSSSSMTSGPATTPAPHSPSSSNIARAKRHFSSFRLLNSTTNSFNFDDPSYITQLACSRSSSAAHQRHANNLIAATSSDFLVKLFDFDNSTGQISFTGHLKAHTDTIHDISFCAQTNAHPNLLLSSSEDGTSICWDVRSRNPSATFKHPEGLPFFSSAVSATTLVCGSTNNSYIWDLRSSRLRATAEDFHQDDVTQVTFHPANPHIVLTGGEDGMINLMDLKIADVDDCLLETLPTEQPVAKFGFFGPNHRYLHVISTVETLSLWDSHKAMQISRFDDVKGMLTRACGQSVNYLLGCRYNFASKRLFLAAGGFGGAITLCHLNQSSIQPFAVLANPEAHSSVVRDVLWFDKTMVTGGQDSKVCIWAAAPQSRSSPPASGKSDQSLPAKMKGPSQEKRPNVKSSPY